MPSDLVRQLTVDVLLGGDVFAPIGGLVCRSTTVKIPQYAAVGTRLLVPNRAGKKLALCVERAEFSRQGTTMVPPWYHAADLN